MVDYLLSEVIEISNDEESMKHSKSNSLEETCVSKEESIEKIFSNKCDRCDFIVEDSKKYGSVKKMLKHKKNDCDKKIVSVLQCNQCDLRAKDKLEFKRHQRDVHELTTASTSPPPKRKRRASSLINNAIEEMEVEEEDEVENLSFKLEDMEIDTEEKSEEEIMIERSNRMDENVLEKQKRVEVKEKIEERKKVESEERKKLEDKNKRKLNENSKGQKQKAKKVKRKNMSSTKEQPQNKI